MNTTSCAPCETPTFPGFKLIGTRDGHYYYASEHELIGKSAFKMAKALGGVISVNPFKEVGWGEVSMPGKPVAASWFGDLTHFQTFHWHGETFSLPPGATNILSSSYCENQAFAMDMHLGMQCHVEMTARMVRDWCSVAAEELAALEGPAVQSISEIAKDLPRRIEDLNAIAERLYLKWITYLK